MTSCCVCGLESSGAHSCSSCLQDVHVICGKINGDEGWGCSVLCNNCTTEPPAKKTSSWSIAYPSRSQELKHKVPNLKQQTEKSEWKTHCVCLTCFENGMEPNIYVMSRRDSSTKNRHVLRRHPQVTLSQISIVNFDSNGKEVSLAREKYYASTNNDKCKKNTSKTQGTLFNFCSVKPVGEDSPTFIYNNKKDASRSNKVTIPHTEATKSFVKVLLQNLQINNVTDWKKISNIIDLTQSIPEIKFYDGNHENSPSVLRCEACFQLLSSRLTGVNAAADPRKIALKGIGRYAGSLSSGLLLTPEKTESIIKGGNNYWYGIKSAVKQHTSCDGEHSQLHFEALQYAATLRKRKSRGLEVTEKLIRIALSVVKSKSAAQQFEHQIAAHIATGSDLGDLGHSRNHFNEILSTINVWLDKQTAKQIGKPLPSTGFQPHFYVSCDKSTPHRISNHAIMICPVVSGKRVAIPVNLPEIYPIDSLNKDGVSGGCAKPLVKKKASI
ncbi:Hypothetical predicted protein [Paramuricea clavata]|uniref:SCAN domain-containing protein n=1 Tax=Paramuricea clavata TaxID=317549 RepID=A0A6S7FRE6_PARCT|nr:Hypothetical predicted protein [Paramuricea clavata]